MEPWMYIAIGFISGSLAMLFWINFNNFSDWLFKKVMIRNNARDIVLQIQERLHINALILKEKNTNLLNVKNKNDEDKKVLDSIQSDIDFHNYLCKENEKFEKLVDNNKKKELQKSLSKILELEEQVKNFTKFIE